MAEGYLEDNFFMTRYPLITHSDERKNRVNPKYIKEMLFLDKNLPDFNPVFYVIEKYPYSSKLQLTLLNAFYKYKYNNIRISRRYNKYDQNHPIVKKVIELRKNNYSIYKISKELKLSTSSVKHIIDRFI